MWMLGLQHQLFCSMDLLLLGCATNGEVALLCVLSSSAINILLPMPEQLFLFSGENDSDIPPMRSVHHYQKYPGYQISTGGP